jgi:CheY-like chemotaxis protein
MDCQMPEMDGYAATKAIRNSKTLNNKISIIALTADAIAGNDEKCLQAGMNAYLTKPIDRSNLEKAIKKFISTDEHKMIEKRSLNQFYDLQLTGRPDILIVVIDSFLNTSIKLVESIRKFVEANDALGAATAAHALKSSAQTLGALELGQICIKIEKLKNQEDTKELLPLSYSLIEVYKKSCQELMQIKEAEEQRKGNKSA